VPAVVLAAWKFSPPAHYVVHDASGKSIAVEYTDSKLNIYDNPLGVMTNSPAFDWQMANLRNYVNFSLTDLPPVQVGSVKLIPFGQGSGMLGLPGDFTPPSRFVRAVAFSQSVLPSQTGYEAILQAFHILNDFDIAKGASRGRDTDEHGNIVADYTLWTSASDLKAKRFYFRSFENSQIRMVDFTKQKLDGKDIVAAAEASFRTDVSEAATEFNPKRTFFWNPEVPKIVCVRNGPEDRCRGLHSAPT
jgi:choloylglycine hydrolase